MCVCVYVSVIGISVCVCVQILASQLDPVRRKVLPVSVNGADPSVPPLTSSTLK